MDWVNERYVRLYTRDSADWVMLPWQARTVFYELIRKVDRSGVIEVGKHGIGALPEILRLPVEVVQVGANALLEDGCVSSSEGRFIVLNFIEAQESRQADAQRKRESRERHRARSMARKAAGQPVTPEPIKSPAVTSGHQESPEVTGSHSVLSCAKPCLDKPDNDLAGWAGLSVKQRSLLQRHLEAALRLWSLQGKLRKELSGTRTLKPTAERLLRVAERLEAGNSEADCEAVLRKYRADASKNPQWFNGETNWRPENFDRALGMSGGNGSTSLMDQLDRAVAEAS